MNEADVRAAFDEAWPALEEALITGETHTKEHIWDRVSDGSCQFWTEGKTSAITSIERYPTGLGELQIWFCGGELDQAQAIHERIENWARRMGLDRIQIVGRSGWMKALSGYRRTAVVMTKDLANG